jgi:hypothetical protein
MDFYYGKDFPKLAEQYMFGSPEKTKTMSKVYFSHTTKLGIVKSGYSPAATVAIKKEGDKFYYGVSICSKYDNFSKKYGRRVAEERMNQEFGVLEIPKPLQDLDDRQASLHQLYNIVASVVLKPKKWKKKVTKFNMTAKVVKMDNPENK